MTVTHMRRVMPTSEFMQWAALYRIEAHEREKAQKKAEQDARKRR